MATILINASRGKDDPERATLPFVMGNNAAVAGQEAIVLLTTDAVWLATEGGAEGVVHEGLPPVAEAMRSFVENGGQIWACKACTDPRGITDDALIAGARIGTSMEVVEKLAQGAGSLSF